MAKEIISFRADDALMMQMDIWRDLQGMNRSEMITEALSVILSFNEFTYKKIRDLSEALHLSEGEILEGFFLDYIARVDTIKDRDGQYQGALPAFTRFGSDGELKRGEDLYKFLRSYYEREYRD